MATTTRWSLLNFGARKKVMAVVFGRFIVQRLQARWQGVHFYCRALWAASEGATEGARLDAGSCGGGIRYRPQLHFRYGAGEEKRLLAHDGSLGAGLRDFAGPACQGARS